MRLQRLLALARKARGGWTGVEYDLVAVDGLFPVDWRSRGMAADPDGAVRVASPAGRYAHPVECAFRIIGLLQTLALTPTELTEPGVAAEIQRTAEALLQAQHTDGSFRYPVAVGRYGTSPGWSSGMAQGLAFHAFHAACPFLESGVRERAAAGADRALEHLLAPTASGGCSDYDDVGRPFFQECPSHPPSFILNGAAFAILGLAVSPCSRAADAARQAAERLSVMLPLWDLGYWSRYDLFDRTPSSPDYHSLHVTLLRALARQFPTLPFAVPADRYAAEREALASRAHAFTVLVADRARGVLIGSDGETK